MRVIQSKERSEQIMKNRENRIIDIYILKIFTINVLGIPEEKRKRMEVK